MPQFIFFICATAQQTAMEIKFVLLFILLGCVVLSRRRENPAGLRILIFFFINFAHFGEVGLSQDEDEKHSSRIDEASKQDLTIINWASQTR